jgi:hypothetical protein
MERGCRGHEKDPTRSFTLGSPVIYHFRDRFRSKPAALAISNEDWRKK